MLFIPSGVAFKVPVRLSDEDQLVFQAAIPYLRSGEKTVLRSTTISLSRQDCENSLRWISGSPTTWVPTSCIVNFQRRSEVVAFLGALGKSVGLPLLGPGAVRKVSERQWKHPGTGPNVIGFSLPGYDASHRIAIFVATAVSGPLEGTGELFVERNSATGWKVARQILLWQA